MLKLSNRVRMLGATLRLGMPLIGLPSPSASRVKFGRSKYMPHIGAKEQERAKRCYMVQTFGRGILRSAPTMCQSAKPRI